MDQDISIRSLHIDIEGGHGGSSRSLYELVSRLDRRVLEPHIVLRQSGPALRWYEELDIATTVVPEIASFVPRSRASLRNLIATAPRFRRILSAADSIGNLIGDQRIGLLHYNYEGLFVLARILRRRFRLPAIAHSRAMIGSNVLGRILAAQLSKSIDKLFCISPNEMSQWQLLSKIDAVQPEIMWNIARKANTRASFPPIPEVVYFGSLDYTKGTDRLVDVAEQLEAIGAPPIKIVIYGAARNHSSYLELLQRRISELGLPDRIALGGYCQDPMAKMASALALIRPSRDDDPWGRDVIEAAAAGLPTIATGTYDGVIKPDVSGWLIAPFDARRIALHLKQLVDDISLHNKMSHAARAIADEVFSGRRQADQFTKAALSLVQHPGEVAPADRRMTV